MIYTYAMLENRFKEYGAPANKIMRLSHSGDLTPIVRGLYEDNPNAPAHALAASIYGPSYLSFEWALSYHGFIPERVYEITSATFCKGRRKTYSTPFGRYTFRDIPSAAFPLGIEVHNTGDYFFRVASPEKALCDQLCKISPAHNQKELQAIISALLINSESLQALDAQKIFEWEDLYCKTNVSLLCKLLHKMNRNGGPNE